MALTVSFTITRSADFKSITIKDNGTAATASGITAITMPIYGAAVDALVTLTFTSGQRATFIAGGDVTINFADFPLTSTWTPTTYAPDNFYKGELTVTDSTATATGQMAFDSYFYIKKIVMTHIAAITIPISDYYEAGRQIIGDLAAMNQLDYLSSVISIDRETKWRKIYDFLAWNYDV